MAFKALLPKEEDKDTLLKVNVYLFAIQPNPFSVFAVATIRQEETGRGGMMMSVTQVLWLG